MKVASVFIGRFQPFHKGHLEILERTAEQSDVVVMVLGSAQECRTLRNPWGPWERQTMILKAVSNDLADRLRFHLQPDHPANDQVWSGMVRGGVYSQLMNSGGTCDGCMDPHSMDQYEVRLSGFDKDHSSFYLKLFPEWPRVDVGSHAPINATDIREAFFGGGPDEAWSESLPESSARYLRGWRTRWPTAFQQLQKAYLESL